MSRTSRFDHCVEKSLREDLRCFRLYSIMSTAENPLAHQTMNNLLVLTKKRGEARAFIAIRRLKHQRQQECQEGRHGSKSFYRDQAFEASMHMRTAIATSVSRVVIAIRRL